MKYSIGSVALGLDPDLGHCGWALVRLEPRRELVLDAGVIRTRVGYGKTEQLSSGDLHRRGRELASELRLVLQRERIAVICAQAPSWVRSAATMQALGRAWGIVDTCAAALDLPVLEATTDDIRQAVAGRQDASPDDVATALRQRYEGEWIARLEDDVPAAKRAHAFDAVGAVVACLPHHTCRTARQTRAA